MFYFERNSAVYGIIIQLQCVCVWVLRVQIIISYIDFSYCSELVARPQLIMMS